jgi:two-component system NtrC family sensor kinase
MTVEFILVFFMFRYLRRSLRNSDFRPQWNKILIGGMIASIVLILAESAFDQIKIITPWIAYLLLSFIVYLMYKREEFSRGKSLIVAILPFILISFLRKIVELAYADFYTSWETYFKAGIIFSLIWMLVMLIITNKQNKALAIAREKTLEEEKQHKIMAELKADLEVQVHERTAELTQQKEELQSALNDLKATQTQLIHSEKMASLGELTAGIAHEIQNPLNFVNNFSEVNAELIDELKEELSKGNSKEAVEIANDLKTNENKIVEHGHRASGIVKGMLEHSRTGSGEKELTDINKLADEYLRLSYHGLRAKDKSFNADFKTEFDEALPKVNVITQDLGRVILNLINNAFYACTERRRSTDSNDYKPIVTVTTKKTGDKIEISVKDNGAGIPNEIKEKVFQPFFTTKPTGSGTGLGLSMSYDIITKGHGGELKVESKEGVGTEFIILLKG